MKVSQGCYALTGYYKATGKQGPAEVHLFPIILRHNRQHKRYFTASLTVTDTQDVRLIEVLVI